MDQTTAACPRLEAMETRTQSLRCTATLRRRPGSSGENRQQPWGPLAAQQQFRSYHGLIERLLQIAQSCNCRGPQACLIHRTAVYGPVCTVGREGRSREPPPYPDRIPRLDASEQEQYQQNHDDEPEATAAVIAGAVKRA